MEKFIRENKKIVIVLVVILGLLFYWFQIRPINIKKNCSWVTETIPADPGVTKEQAELNKKSFDEQQCGKEKLISSRCFQLKTDTVERLPQPERKEITEATEKEYNLCLRQNGL